MGSLGFVRKRDHYPTESYPKVELVVGRTLLTAGGTCGQVFPGPVSGSYVSPGMIQMIAGGRRSLPVSEEA